MLHMMILRKKQDGYHPQTKIQKRIHKLPTSELIAWSENALFVIGRDLTSWMRSNDKALLDEVEVGAEALYEIVQELKRRA
jgi:hypothetical protein